MTITNETILKAAKAAGLDVTESPDGILWRHEKGVIALFTPKLHDTDNALIRRGAEIDVGFFWERKDSPASIDAVAWIKQPNGDMQGIDQCVVCGNDKAQAEREAVILCAAAKWDAQGEKA